MNLNGKAVIIDMLLRLSISCFHDDLNIYM